MGRRSWVQPSQAESTKGKDVVIGEEWPPRMIKPKCPKDDQWWKNEGSKPQKCPKVTLDILMAKYQEGRVGIRGRENRTIRNSKLDSPVSLSQASMFAAESLSDKLSQTLPYRNSEGRDLHCQGYHLASYFLVGPPMPGPLGPLPMMCPPWVGWYRPWIHCRCTSPGMVRTCSGFGYEG
jgi:hypothetical protein